MIMNRIQKITCKYIVIFPIVTVLFLLNLSHPTFAQQNDANIKKAVSLMEKGSYREASDILEEILRKDPQNNVVLYNLALCNLYTGRADLALRHIRRFLQNNQRDADANNLLGLALERLGRIDSAIISYSNAIRFDKNYYEAYFNRGRCHVLQKKIDEAKADFNSAKRNKTINPELYIASGSLNYELGFFDSAIADLRKIAKYKNDDIHYLLMFANSFFRQSSLDSAIKYYSQILEIDPDNITVLNNRAICYSELELREQAEADREKIEEVRRRVEFNPDILEYRQLVATDSAFSILLPENWRVFARQDNNSSEVIFFDTNFSNSVENGIYQYAFGGTVVYFPQHFQPDSILSKSLQIREMKVIEHQQNRKRVRSEIMNGFFERTRKTYNPNDVNARELTKARYFDVNTNEEFFGIEYFIMTTTGKLVCLYLWIPNESAFIYESLMDRIQNSLQILKN